MAATKICRLCKSAAIKPFLKFGQMPLAGGFLKPEEIAGEKKYDLTIFFCQDCTSVQVTEAIPGDTLFRNYFYFSSVSKLLSDHFAAYAGELKERFLPEKDGLVVEIGANDGVLLRPLKELGVSALGVDPARNVAEQAVASGLEVIPEYFTSELADEIKQTRGEADAICANNVFAHIEDMDSVVEGVTKLLKPDGVFVFEVHYLMDLLEGVQYDMMYHEHIFNHSLTALTLFLARFGLEPFEVKRISIHAGSIRVYAKRKTSSRAVDSSVAKLLAEEEKAGVKDFKTYEAFAGRVEKTKADLRRILEEIKAKGQRVAGYGAAGRATMILNYCGITTDLLPYMVDASPAKRGHVMPGMHIPIYAEEKFREEKPEYMLLFAWSYKTEVMQKEHAYTASGGKVIVPLPSVEVL